MSLSKNTVANLAGAFVPLAATIFTVPIYLQTIGNERYGVLAIIWTILTYFYFFDAGLGKATAQRIATLGRDKEREAREILWTAMTMTCVIGAIGGIVLWFFADVLLTQFIKMDESYRAEALSAIPWLILAMPLVVVGSTMGGALQARERFVEINLAKVIAAVVNLVLPLVVALYGKVEIQYLVAAALVGNFLLFVMFYAYCVKHVPLTGMPRIYRAHVVPLFRYGGGISLISIIAPILVTFDRILIGALMGAKAVPFYAVPYSLASRMLVFSGSLSNAIFPRLAAQGESDARELSVAATTSLMAFMTILTVVAILLVDPFLRWWVGGEFAAQAEGVGEVLLWGIWVNGLVTAHYAHLQAAGRLAIILKVYVIEIPIYLFVLWFGIDYFGILGAALAWSLRVVLDTVIFLNICQVLRSTIRENGASLLLVTLALAVSFGLQAHALLYWLAALVIVVVATVCGWGKISPIVTRLFHSKRVTGKVSAST